MKNFMGKQQTKKKMIIPNTCKKLLKEHKKKFVDPPIHPKKGQQRKAVLSKAVGLWRDRNDLLYFNETRSEWDRL